jgi:hypothetical protein
MFKLGLNNCPMDVNSEKIEPGLVEIQVRSIT